LQFRKITALMTDQCEVAMNAWVIHRDKKIFGSDADQFNPARWLSNDSKTKTDMDKHSLTVRTPI
jgi:hypothetical protein